MVTATAVCLVSSWLILVDGSDFLSAQQHHLSETPISREEVEQAFFFELDAINTSTAARLEEELRALFVTMPKNENNNLEPSSVRYVLHRYFAQKHGWHLIGLDKAAGAWNTSQPTAILKNQVPTYIEDIFETKIKANGLGLSELAVLAATLSDLIARETSEEMDYIYRALKFPKDALVSKQQLKRLFRSFLVAKTWGLEEGNAAMNLKNAEKKLEQSYLGWDVTKMWESDELESVDLLHSRRNPFQTGYSFDSAVEIAAQLNHRHSQFHFLQCRSLKNQLLELEHRGTGRVLLSKFYSGANSPDWAFVEKKDYLRDIGVLDETDPKRPSVIIQNYLLGPSNCLETSGYYSLCCRDECEDILAQVETNLGMPSGSPTQIVDIVSSIGSDSVHAPRNLSMAHMTRLIEIAEHHGGVVPLHGRLFAQWLHHVFPQECPFPHVAGTVSHKTPDEWASERGLEDANEKESIMFKHKAQIHELPEHESLPWTAVEELVSVHKRGEKPGSSVWGSLRKVALLSLLVSVAYSTSSVVKVSASPHKKVESHLV